MQLDSAIVKLLGLDPDQTTVSGAGGGGCSSASTSKITSKLPSGESREFFMKSGKGKESATMFEGEHTSLKSLHDVVPTLCPQSYGHGPMAESHGMSYLVTDFINLSGRFSRGSSSSGMSLPQKLAKLHNTPAPTPNGYDKPQFGFPVTTCCGDMAQDNSYSSSWADFYANRRLRFIANASRKSNGPDPDLDAMVETMCTKVVPRLIGDDHLNNGKGVMPVVVHGDLWSGNASMGKLPGMKEPEDITYDSSACYAHSEYELGDMKMFGGFGGAFMREYHELVPKTEPVEEYDDRVKLYELYHHLNHHAMFGGGYRSGAVSFMKELIRKYGQ